MSSLQSFNIDIPTSRLTRVKQKLALTDFPSEIHSLEDPWSRGAPLSDIRRLTHYWLDGFSWRKVEEALNKLPQYIAKIKVEGFGDYNVHFVHQKSPRDRAIPLLFIHGWPGSFIEVTKMLPDLVNGGKDFPAFNVVAPSLIDFGFPSASGKKGFRVEQHAETCHKLMLALGYNEYVVQGGDLGYLVSRAIARNYGLTHCKAYHINNSPPAAPTPTSHPSLYDQMKNAPLTPTEQAGLQRSEHFSKEGNGYYRLQSTKPQTIGYSLTDSPIGLLAWIYEKLHDWSDDYPWTDDEILTWVSLYYFSTAGPAAPSSLYYEMEHSLPSAFEAAQAYVDVPLGIARFPKDLILLPKLWNQTLGPLVLESEDGSGGHFAAWERPDALVRDLRSMFNRDGGAFGCVDGLDGFED